MSDRPRMGRVSGRELEETRAGASGLPAVPNMLMNSVSGEVIVRTSRNLDAAALKVVQLGS
jgi:hypothetical protein